MEIQQQVLQIKAPKPKRRVKIDENCDPLSKSAAFLRASKVQASLPPELPSFVKPMSPSHVSASFCLGLPKKFCDAHMPKQDETIVLVDEDGKEFNTKFLVEKTGLSSGWRAFSIGHKLREGDALVFQLIDSWKFKVYIVRVHGLNATVTVSRNQIEFGLRNSEIAEDMDIDSHQQNVQDKALVVLDQSGDGYADSDVLDGLRFSQSVLDFNDIQNIDDFSIVVDDLVVDSEIPKHFRIKYYELCHSQKSYLHENLLKGFNVKLAVGIILETVTIADAIKACKVDIARDDLATWDKTLKAFEDLGMKVGFLRARLCKLVGLLFELNELLEAKKNEQVKAEEEMRRVREVIKNLDVEIESLELKGKNLELAFCTEANAPW
ncbi:putative transcription factor B3-Domain family [Helianthus annuus]|nr:putative transcription factor B3-Domain family [Helianthus annuus]